MQPQKDAYGQILYDIHTGENPNAREIVERDDGFIEEGNTADTYFTEYPEWSTQIQKSIDEAKGKVLDVGCGAGRHSLYLQSKGHKVKGIDLSRKAIKVCRDRGLNNTSHAGIDDIHTLNGLQYNTILLLGNNLGLLGTEPIRRLNELARRTSSDGIIIGQTREATKTDEQHHQHYHEFNKSRGRRPGCLRIRIRYRNYKTDWYDYLYIDYDNLINLLKSTPWSVREKYDDGVDSTYTVVLEK